MTSDRPHEAATSTNAASSSMEQQWGTALWAGYLLLRLSQVANAVFVTMDPKREPRSRTLGWLATAIAGGATAWEWRRRQGRDPTVDDPLMAAEVIGTSAALLALSPYVVHADGRVEWEDDAGIPAGQEDRVRAELKAATGAGDAEKWAEWSRQVMQDTFQTPEDQGAIASGELPVPVAVRLDLAKDALEDPDPLSQTFIESEITFDGETWRDLYDEEMPPELLLAIANMKPNPSGEG